MHILLQQNVLAHYRRGLIRELTNLPDLRLSLVSSSTSDTPFLELAKLPASSHINTVDAPLKTWRVSRAIGISWQPGAIVALKLKPDVVIAMGSPYSLTAWALVVLGRLRKIPVLLWTHGLLEPETGAKWKVRSALYRLASGLLLYGDRARQMLIRQGMDPSNLHVVYNSLDVAEQQEAYDKALALDLNDVKRRWKVSDAERVIIFSGRLQRVKQIDRIIGAIALLKARGRNVHLLLIGDGELRVELEQKCRESKVDQLVHFCGEIHSEERLAEAYRASDLCVIPSGPGLMVMHSLVYRVPVLTTNQENHRFPEAEAIIPEKTGFFCETNNPASLAEELERVLFPRSPQASMGAACLSMILEKFTPKKQAQRMFDAAKVAYEEQGNYAATDHIGL